MPPNPSVSKPLLQRPIDILFILFYTASVLYGLLFSLPEAINVPVTADSPWPPLRLLYDWALTEEHGHLQVPLPLPLRTAAFIDGWAHSPFLCVMIYAMLRGRNWIRLWAIFFAGSSITNMYYYFMYTFLGDHPPPNTAYYLLFNLPWLLVPILLAWRMRKPEPFAHSF